jgi:lytic cellulose monooxygenase (C4-dehydrogenating)
VRTRSRVLAAFAAALSAAGLVVFGAATPAAAHGSAIDPPARNYGCWQRWGHDFQNPAMATEDPMCWQAWQDNPNAMWNWNGLYRNEVGGNPQAVIPDGQLCSAGHTEGARYRSMDTVGDWKAVDKPRNFTINIYDQALHGADYYKVYITRQGFDPVRQPLRWSDLELVREVGETPPQNTTLIPVDAGSRTGRHIVYTIWQASHMDQSYYFCSDVNFTG